VASALPADNKFNEIHFPLDYMVNTAKGVSNRIGLIWPYTNGSSSLVARASLWKLSCDSSSASRHRKSLVVYTDTSTSQMPESLVVCFIDREIRNPPPVVGSRDKTMFSQKLVSTVVSWDLRCQLLEMFFRKIRRSS